MLCEHYHTMQHQSITDKKKYRNEKFKSKGTLPRTHTTANMSNVSDECSVTRRSTVVLMMMGGRLADGD